MIFMIFLVHEAPPGELCDIHFNINSPLIDHLSCINTFTDILRSSANTQANRTIEIHSRLS